MSPFPERLSDHWWWRPGVWPGRTLLVWHILFAAQPQVREIAAVCQDRLAGVPGLDLVPAEWLHMTTYMVGFADEIDDGVVVEMVTAVTKRLALIEPVTVTLGRPLFDSEAAMLGIRPADALAPVYDAVVAGVGETVGDGHVANSEVWIPHVSVAYANAEGPAEPVIRALRPGPDPCELTIGEVQLVGQQRVGHLYRWEPIASARLGR